MVIPSRNRLAIGGATLLVWGLAAASVGYWVLRPWSAGSGTAPVPAAAGPAGPAVDPQAVARLLGATEPVAAAPASLASRFALKGVVAEPGGGAALISVDGQPPRPFKVGGGVAEGLVLQSVAPRRATLGAGLQTPALATLELPPLRP